MGIPILILGRSGTGKTSSLRNFKCNDIELINVSGKPAPFKNDFQPINTNSYKDILNIIHATKRKIIIIDDSQYLMAFELFETREKKGYDRFENISYNFVNLIKTIITKTPKDTLVYLLHHTDTDETGQVKAKTVGKMIDNHITLEGLFNIVLLSNKSNDTYTFFTKNSGQDIVKSPFDMFEREEIDNDLKFVDDVIREYYNLTPNNKKEN